jgi:putative addiction module component (TIGR02574 family)
MTPELRAAVFALSVEEKLELVQDLWDSIAEEDAPPLSAAQLEELERRWKKHLENPGLAISGEEFFRRMEARYGR